MENPAPFSPSVPPGPTPNPCPPHPSRMHVMRETFDLIQGNFFDLGLFQVWNLSYLGRQCAYTEPLETQ